LTLPGSQGGHPPLLLPLPPPELLPLPPPEPPPLPPPEPPPEPPPLPPPEPPPLLAPLELPLAPPSWDPPRGLLAPLQPAAATPETSGKTQRSKEGARETRMREG
jgi:hypothetical protein